MNEALCNGITLWRRGALDDAEASFRRAVVAEPRCAEAHERLGTLLAARRGPAVAEPHLLRAVELDAGRAGAWCNLAIGWISSGRFADAAAAVERALRARPDFDHAHATRALILALCYRHRAAIQAYGRAIELNPRHFQAQSARLVELEYMGELPRAALFAEHRRFAKAAGERRTAAPARPAAAGGRPLRVGFLSPDLHRHSVAYFLEPLLAHADRARCELYLYYDNDRPDDVSQRLQDAAARWRGVAGLNDDVLEKLIRSDRPDVLVDLAGHTGKNRLPLFARRLAPVQLTYLGYPDTTGLENMDYRLVDAVTDPEGEADRFCSERLVRFSSCAWTYLPPKEAPAPGPAPASAGAGPTFGCFNNLSKITDECLAAWGQVISQTPGSRLLLKGVGLSTESFQNFWRKRCEGAGLSAERVELVERSADLAGHLALYGKVDVALDTFPYHGTTTTCEAMWMGVPVVTLAGDRHACRVGVSLLQAVGHPEWIATDWKSYVATASRLGAEAGASAEPRVALRQRLSQSIILDHAGQAGRFWSTIEQLARGNPA